MAKNSRNGTTINRVRKIRRIAHVVSHKSKYDGTVKVNVRKGEGGERDICLESLVEKEETTKRKSNGG